MTDVQTSETAPYPCLALIVEKFLVPSFFRLLQQGVMIRSRIGCSIEAFLQEEIKASPETIGKIQSVILDGRPVDDIAAAVLHDGSTLALSAAMPGLVGATLRRGGAYSSLRSTITHHETGNACMTGKGWLRIKIFNLLMAELGPELLRRGVLIETAEFFCLIDERAQEFHRRVSIMLNNRAVEIGMLKGDAGLAGADRVLLLVDGTPAGHEKQ